MMSEDALGTWISGRISSRRVDLSRMLLGWVGVKIGVKGRSQIGCLPVDEDVARDHDGQHGTAGCVRSMTPDWCGDPAGPYNLRRNVSASHLHARRRCRGSYLRPRARAAPRRRAPEISCVKTIDDKAQYLGRPAKLLSDLEQKQTVDVAHRTEGDASCAEPIFALTVGVLGWPLAVARLLAALLLRLGADYLTLLISRSGFLGNVLRQNIAGGERAQRNKWVVAAPRRGYRRGPRSSA